MVDRVQRVGDRCIVDLFGRIGQQVAEAQVVVHVDHARHEPALAQVDHLAGLCTRAEVLGGSDIRDAATLDFNHGVLKRWAATPIQEGACLQQQ